MLSFILFFTHARRFPLGINNGAMQVLNLAFGIITARILNDSDYGMVGMLSIFSLIAGSLQESGFTAALVNKKEISHQDYNAVFWFCSGLSLTLYLILAGCAPLIAKLYPVSLHWLYQDARE